MLVLTRKVGERIVLHVPGQQPITIDLASTRGSRAQLAIDAPQTVRILRAEQDPTPRRPAA